MELTHPEFLIISRRRSRLSQQAMGRTLNVSRRTYGKMEKEESPLSTTYMDLTPAEKCFILRRRSGLTQSQVSDLMGLSRFWINQKEMGHVEADDLIAFWNQRQ